MTEGSVTRTAAPLAAINRIFPEAAAGATDEQLLQWYGELPHNGPWVRFNFVSSLDGAATYEGRSGALGNEVDQHVFSLLRRLADVIVIGAGTIRAEGYGGELLSAESRQWRIEHGMPARPAFAVVSGSLNLDPESELFVQAPVRPLLLTTARADAGRRRALEEVADVVDAGDQRVEPVRIVEILTSRGLTQIHSEGGPTLLGSFEAAGLVDELCLTMSPILAGGTGKRVADHVAEHAPQAMRLAHILESDSMLLLRYLSVAPASQR
ncbi:pyrimidine reductase family protein [Arthrobacter sp. VKM Ac-2550]|uniref:pyrimidine reductase family protein n=1 Tax=Crystallibacter permensis TaxID=1938888 RepID=UPI0022262EF2|nr:pyrimidine reductase family protein [Arthrobacter sp. VKM Ac-2550]MCW2132771.1 Pyrimidine reductase, riboflavin biosynthesis [Arthrobacter sp. VKM Ac-2550]